MKITFSLIDNNGNTYHGSAALLPVRNGAYRHKTATKLTEAQAETSFDQNPRAFMKKYSPGLAGAKKFTLLLARLSEGNSSNVVPLTEIVGTWNKMRAILGDFNRAYPTRAKEYGWVDTPKAGCYVLSSTWKGALQKHA